MMPCPLLALAQQATLTWVSREDGPMEPALLGDIDGRVFSSTAENGTARNPFFQDAFQFLSQFELLRGMPLHS